jgi:hypothetical protein
MDLPLLIWIMIYGLLSNRDRKNLRQTNIFHWKNVPLSLIIYASFIKDHELEQIAKLNIKKITVVSCDSSLLPLIHINRYLAHISKKIHWDLAGSGFVDVSVDPSFKGAYILQNCYSLNLKMCYITDVRPFRNVNHLILDNNPIVDISPLNAESLSLAHCLEITDFTPLSNVKSLDLSYTKVEDVSFLKNVRRLSLRGCRNVIGLEKLTNLEFLDVSETKIDITQLIDKIHTIIR